VLRFPFWTVDGPHFVLRTRMQAFPDATTKNGRFAPTKNHTKPHKNHTAAPTCHGRPAPAAARALETAGYAGFPRRGLRLDTALSTTIPIWKRRCWPKPRRKSYFPVPIPIRTAIRFSFRQAVHMFQRRGLRHGGCRCVLKDRCAACRVAQRCFTKAAAVPLTVVGTDSRDQHQILHRGLRLGFLRAPDAGPFRATTPPVRAGARPNSRCGRSGAEGVTEAMLRLGKQPAL
jgi:hypothetical protein